MFEFTGIDDPESTHPTEEKPRRESVQQVDGFRAEIATRSTAHSVGRRDNLDSRSAIPWPSATLTMVWTVRVYRPKEHRFLVACLEEQQDHMMGLDQFHDLRREQHFGEAWARWHLRNVRHRGGRIFIAERSGVPVGFASCVLHTPDPLERLEYRPLRWGGLTGIFVVPGARSSGVGKALVRAVERYLIRKACNRMSLTVFAPNELALGLYRTLGYQPRYVRMAKKLK